MKSFGDVLLYLRKRSNISQADLGSVIGVAKSTISMYERGERKPSFEMLEAIADYFNVDMDFLTGKSDIMRKQTFAVLSPDEDQLIEDYRSLTPPGQEYIRQTMAMAKQSYGEKISLFTTWKQQSN